MKQTKCHILTLLPVKYTCRHITNISFVYTCTCIKYHHTSCIYSLQVCRYKRLSPLVPLNSSLGGQFKSIRSGDCVVVFSREKLLRVRRKIETATKKACAIIYGGLPSGKSPFLKWYNKPHPLQYMLLVVQSPTMNASLVYSVPGKLASFQYHCNNVNSVPDSKASFNC